MRLVLLLVLGACTMAEDVMRPPADRCAEAVSLYDEAPGVAAGLLTFGACIR